MDKNQDLKKEIYEYVSKFNLSEEEVKMVDTYVLRLIEDLSVFFSAQADVLEDSDKLQQFKKLILENMGDKDIG